MVVQVPCRVHSEVPQEVAVWANQTSLGQCIPRACPAQGMPDRGRALDARSCAHVDIDSTEVFGVRGDRVSEREELDLDRAERRAQAAEFSGPQVPLAVPLQTPSSAGGYWLANRVMLISYRVTAATARATQRDPELLGQTVIATSSSRRRGQ